MILGLQGLTITGGYRESGSAVQIWGMPIVIENCVFRDNVSTEAGGAIHDYYGMPRIIGSRFVNNSTSGMGGALVAESGFLYLEDCLFSGNTAAEGGAVWARTTYADTIISCTFVANEAPVASGIYYSDIPNSSIIVDRCIVAGGLAGAGFTWDGFGTLDMSCTDIYGNEGGDWVGNIAGLAGLNGNLAENPLFCGAAYSAEPYAISSESPCAPDNNPGCGLIGALSVGCGVTGIPHAMQPLRLHPNHPNPFNPATTIAFELAASATVTLRILDVSGRLVRTLIEEEMTEAGYSETTWNGTDDADRPVAAGFYVCRIEADGFVDVGRMILLK